jgi:hypothetical protein
MSLMGAEGMLRQLIMEYGLALHLPTGDNLIAAHIAHETKLAKGTVLGILNGSTDRLNENTRRRLATFFNQKAVPQIQPVWFLSSSLDEFNLKRAGSGVIPLAMPADYNRMAAAMENWLCGTHIVYRYSLDFISTGEVAREVIHIWHNGTFLQFKMSIINRSGRNDGPNFYFEGPVLLVGRSVVLFGTNIGPQTIERECDRACVIVLDHDNAGPDTQDCKIGLMTSTRPRRDMAPCTASTIFIRTAWNAELDLEELTRTATVIRSLDATINDDFGVMNGPLIKLFLDNRPHGSKLEAEMQPYDNFFGREPERILRLDTDRFATTMHQILSEIIANDAITAPFKQNWIAHMQERKRERESRHGTGGYNAV